MGIKRLKAFRGNKGQVSILIGTMLLTFILFFAFVVNTGMLIHAKINLQNAADLAAYAGAAVQARQLNHISYLNYEMRRQYKKFLFRYYVVGTMSWDSARSAPATGEHQWIPNDNDGVDWRVPSVCLIFNRNDNFCHLASLSPIPIPPDSYMDQINQTLRGQLQAIETARIKSCEEIDRTNIQILSLWVWNTDPELTSLPPNTTMAKNLGRGLGIVPKEGLLKARINTLEYYVNFEPQNGVTLSKVNELMNSSDPARRERTIQAFYSAYYTLGDHIFNSEETVMDELLPPGAEGANLLRLEPLTVKSTTYATKMETGSPPGANVTVVDEGRTCIAKVAPMKIEMPIGVKKDPTILTYYAIRLQAKAKVLFSPFGDMQLKAYAAAQPFGSRIGPPITDTDFLKTDVAPDSNQGGAIVSTGTQDRSVPNLPMLTPGDSGWYNNAVFKPMLSLLSPSGNNPVDVNLLEKAYAKAMAPTPAEVGLYNIPADIGSDPFVRHFDAPGGTYAFWAPVFPLDKAGQSNEAENEINTLIGTVLGQTDMSHSGDAFRQEMVINLQTGLETYLGKLREGRGENGEGYNIARITDPLRPATVAGENSEFLSVPGVTTSDASKIKSSWDTVKDANLRNGRSGYSVKFVSLKGLTTGAGMTANGASPWTNTFPMDDQTKDEIQKIQH